MRKSIAIILTLIAALPSLAQTPADDKEVRAAVKTFLSWYVDVINTKKYEQLVTITVAPNGTTQLDDSKYFKALDSLGVLSKEFIQSEKVRLKPCADALLLRNETTITPRPSKDHPCGVIASPPWIGPGKSNISFDILDVQINRNKATVQVSFFSEDDERTKYSKVRLVRAFRGWRITSIE